MTDRRPRRWIGFFVVLAVLSLAAMIAPLVYNLSLQLRPEQVVAARQRWRDNEPANYDLECLIKHEGDETTEQTYLLRVRYGRAVIIVDQGEVVYVEPSLIGVAGPALLALSAEKPTAYGMATLFDEIESALRRRETVSGRDYVKADFDPRDGHPYHFIQRQRGSKNRVEWFVKLTQLERRAGPR